MEENCPLSASSIERWGPLSEQVRYDCGVSCVIPAHYTISSLHHHHQRNKPRSPLELLFFAAPGRYNWIILFAPYLWTNVGQKKVGDAVNDYTRLRKHYNGSSWLLKSTAGSLTVDRHAHPLTLFAEGYFLGSD